MEIQASHLLKYERVSTLEGLPSGQISLGENKKKFKLRQELFGARRIY